MTEEKNPPDYSWTTTEKNMKTWWGQDATRILDYIEKYRGMMSDFEVLEDIMCGSYVDEYADHSECSPDECEIAYREKWVDRQG